MDVKHKLRLCEKCDNYIFPEMDEDGIWGNGCRNPNVLDHFHNFMRKRKCKYFQKISYEKLLKIVKRILGEIKSFMFYYRDSKHLRKASKTRLSYLKWKVRDYLNYRDFLFSLKKVIQDG